MWVVNVGHSGGDLLPLDRQPQSLCILRLSALGDATHTLPVVRAIQQHWPGTRISWIIGKLERRLLAGVDGVEFLVFDKRGGWGEVRRLREALRGRHFDVLLHLQVAARANLLSRLVEAPVRLGWDRARSRDFHHWLKERLQIQFYRVIRPGNRYNIYHSLLQRKMSKGLHLPSRWE